MDERAQRRAAFLADLERAIRRRKLRDRLRGRPTPTIPTIVNTALLAAVNRSRHDPRRDSRQSPGAA